MSQPISYPCPDCGQVYRLAPEYLAQFGGKTTRCTGCGQTFQLPAAQDVAAAPAPAAPSGPALGYAAPQWPAAPAGGVWRDRSRAIVARVGAQFPQRCIKCNAPADGPPEEFRLLWSPVQVRGQITMMRWAMSQQEIVLQAYMCNRHRVRMRLARSAGTAILAGGVAGTGIGILVAAAFWNGIGPWVGVPLAAVSLLAALVGGVWMLIGVKTLWAEHIDDSFGQVAGFGQEFLAHLPSARQARAAAAARAGANLEHLTD